MASSNPFKERAHQRDAQRALWKALSGAASLSASSSNDAIQAALNQGATLTGFSPEGIPILHELLDLSLHSVTRMREALAAGAGLEDRPQDRDQRQAFPFTPLLKAAWCGTADEVLVLLEHGASLKAVSGKDVAQLTGDTMPRWDGSTAVHLACHQPDPEVLKVLLDAGGRVDVYDRQGRQPLHAALLSRRRVSPPNQAVVTIALLLDAGADPNVPMRGKRRDATATGDRPLHLAADRASLPDVLALLNAGADPGVLDSQGRTPLQRAQQRPTPQPVIVAALERLELTRTVTGLPDHGTAATSRRRL